MTEPADATARLIEVMARLRHPETGCAWDQVQDFRNDRPLHDRGSLRGRGRHRPGSPATLLDELGDLLFQVVYHARMAEERGWFAFADVAAAITDKMIRRHPHVFGAEETRTADQQVAAWEVQKEAERAARAETGTLAGIPTGLPGADPCRQADATRRPGRLRLARRRRGARQARGGGRRAAR